MDALYTHPYWHLARQEKLQQILSIILNRENSVSIHVKSNQNWIVITLFPNDSAPNGIPFGDNSIGKVYPQSNFGLIQRDSKLSWMNEGHLTRREIFSKSY